MPSLPSGVVEFFTGWALLAAVVVTAGWLLARLVPMPTRMRVGLLTLAAILSLSPLTRPFWPLRGASGPSASLGLAATDVPSSSARSGGPPSTTISPPFRNSVPQGRPYPVEETILWAWWLGAVLAWVGLARSIAKMNRLRDTAVVGDDGLRRSDQLISPVAAGFPRAEVIVPEHWPSPFLSDEAEAALHHEQGHVEGRHVAFRIAGEVIAAWFWWLPTGWLCNRVLEESFEELADQRSANHRAALARALVRVSESLAAVPRHCSGMASSASHIEHRIRALMEVRPMNPLRKLFAVVALAAFAFSGAVFAGTLLSQPAPVESYGLVPGASWTYESIAENGEKSITTTVASRAIPFEGRTVIELTAKSDLYTSYSYVSVDSKGYWSYHNSRMQGPGFVRTETPEPVWKLPLRKGATWRFRQPFRGQIMIGDGGEPNLEDLAFDCSASVIATGEPVEVPAGSYRAAHIRIDRVSKANGTNSTDLWIVEGIGVVRSIDRYPSGTWERRLTSFTPGNGVKLVVPAGYTRILEEPVVDHLSDVYAYGPLERGRRSLLRLGAVNHVFDAMDEGSVSEAAFQGLSERGDVSDRLTALAILAALQNGANPTRLSMVTSSLTVDSDGARRFVALVEDGVRSFTLRYGLTKTAVTSVQIEIGR